MSLFSLYLSTVDRGVNELAGWVLEREQKKFFFFFFFFFLQLVELDTYIDGATGVAVKDGNGGGGGLFLAN